ncbi:hypothetical protein D5086_009349 [Populus alba]|uniref:Uncharacterized protein n=1 Tax=Populus alba TaxID=43335 RepID=A0ACC4CJC9_POPAL
MVEDGLLWQKGSDYRDWWKVREIFGLNTLVIYKHVGFELIVFGNLTTSIQLLFQFISEACFAKHKLICRLYNESASHMSYFPALLDFYFISLAAILNPRGDSDWIKQEQLFVRVAERRRPELDANEAQKSVLRFQKCELEKEEIRAILLSFAEPVLIVGLCGQRNNAAKDENLQTDHYLNVPRWMTKESMDSKSTTSDLRKEGGFSDALRNLAHLFHFPLDARSSVISD